MEDWQTLVGHELWDVDRKNKETSTNRGEERPEETELKRGDFSPPFCLPLSVEGSLPDTSVKGTFLGRGTSRRLLHNLRLFTVLFN